ncbi:MAG TPA: LEPR-XLL domain-containing protein, partial [Stellaceae bacterium]|nr:LEPR-XLL domain-containing protein [Stellaceae bacterium]
MRKRHRFDALSGSASAIGLLSGQRWGGSTPAFLQPRRGRAKSKRSKRNPLAFEMLEPRILLSGDPISSAVQTGLLDGLAAFKNFVQQLQQDAKLVEHLPIVSSSLGDVVHLPDRVQNEIVAPAQAYFAALPTGQQGTIQDLATALQAVPGITGTVLGQFADGEYLLTLQAWSNAQQGTAPINLPSSSTGINLQLGPTTALSTTATTTLNLSLGYDTKSNANTFFIEKASLTEQLQASLTGIGTSVKLGVGDASVAGGSATLNANASITLVDQSNANSRTYITQAEMASIALPQIETTTLSGSADLTLPISSSFLPGGPQTLKLDWSGDLSSVGTVSVGSVTGLGALGNLASLDTINGAMLQKAISALPSLITSATQGAAFAGNIPLIGNELGNLFDFGTKFADAANQITATSSLNDVTTALQSVLGKAVTVQVNSTDLEFVVSSSSSFDTSLPFALSQQVQGASLQLSGNIHATGTASASVRFGISFDTSKADQDRIYIIQGADSAFSIAFKAVTDNPISATAALGLLRLSATGTLRIGAQLGGSVDPNNPAQATLSLRDPNNTGRATLRQILANPASILATPTYTGAAEAALTLAGPGGTPTVPITIDYFLTNPTSPNIQVNTSAFGSLLTNPSGLLSSFQLTAGNVSTLAQIQQWAANIEAAFDATAGLTTSLPLVGDTLSHVLDLKPLLQAVNTALQAILQPGTNTAQFATSLANQLATLSTPELTLSADTAHIFAGLVSGTDANTLSSLGLPAGGDRLVFNLSLTAAESKSQQLTLSTGGNALGISFQATGTVTGSLGLGLTFGVDLSQPSPVDAFFVRLNNLTAGLDIAATNANFNASIGALGAQVKNGSFDLKVQASLAQAADKGAPAAPQTLNQVLGVSPGSYLSFTPIASSLTANLPLSAAFGGLASASATIQISGDPLSGNAPSVTLTGVNAPDFSNFTSVTPDSLLTILKTIANTIQQITGNNLLAQKVPFTSTTLGQVLNFGQKFLDDVVTPLTGSNGQPTFTGIQDLVTKLGGLAGVDPSSFAFGYDTSAHRMTIQLTLAESFDAVSSPFTYNLNIPALSNVLSASGSLSVSASGKVTVGIAVDLSDSGPEVDGGRALPNSEKLVSGQDAHFQLILDGNTANAISVTVAASDPHFDGTFTGLVNAVNASLQAALAAAGQDADLVAASVTGSSVGTVLAFKVKTGSGHTLSLQSQPDDPAVSVLGLIPSGTTSTSITGTKPLPANGTLASPASFTLTADGEAPVTITVPAGSYSSPAGIVNQVTTALASLNSTLNTAHFPNIVASLDTATSLYLVLSTTGFGDSIEVQATPGSAADTELGLPPNKIAQAGAPVITAIGSAGIPPLSGVLTQDANFSIAVDGRTPFAITIKAADTASFTTSNQLIDLINQKLQPVNADLASAGLDPVVAMVDMEALQQQSQSVPQGTDQSQNGSDPHIKFTTSGFGASIELKDSGGAAGIGIGADDKATAAPVTIAGSASLAQKLFLTDLELSAGIQIGGTFSASANFGIIGVTLSTVASDPTSISGQFDLKFSPNLQLSNLLANLGTLQNYVTGPTLTGTGNLDLQVAISGALASDFNIDQNAHLKISSGTNVNILNPSVWTIDTSGLEGLQDFSLSNFSFTTVLQGLNDLASFLTQLTGNGNSPLAQKLPVINKSVDDLLGFVSEFSQSITQFQHSGQSGAAATLDELATALDQAIATA